MKMMAGQKLPKKVRVIRRKIISAAGSLGLLCTSLLLVLIMQAPVSYAQGTQSVIWPAFDGGGQRSGVNSSETILTSSSVKQLKLLWQVTLPAVADSSPVELPQVQTPNGIKTLLFVTTKSGSLLAIDAATGSLVWRKDTSGPKFTTSSPAIDPSKQYVYSYGLDGFVHKYAVGDGTEVVNSTWPALLTRMPDVEKGSSSLNIAKGYLYMTAGGYPGDAGHYEGHVIAVNLTTGIETVFNALCANIKHVLGPNDCSDVQSAIWGRAGAVVDPITKDVYVTTGNGPFRTDGRSFGDSIIKLSPDLNTILDSYTPSNYASLQANDQDLGSAAPALLPYQAKSSTPNMMVQAGKDNTLRLVNRDNLSGQGGPDHVGGELQAIPLPQSGDVDTHPAVWNDSSGTTWVFVANFQGFSAFRVVTDATGHTSLRLAYQDSHSGSSPFIAHGILYLQGSGVIYALKPSTGAVLWRSTQSSAGGTIGSLHWQSPIVVNGHLYALDNAGHFSAYGLN